jgi:Domain of unknown function (DUF6794)
MGAVGSWFQIFCRRQQRPEAFYPNIAATHVCALTSDRVTLGLILINGYVSSYMRVVVAIILVTTMLLEAGCHSTPRTTSAELRARHPQWPLTVNDAVTRILAGMSTENKEKIRATKKDDLILYHHGWGTGIRNEFGLWNGNYSLMSDCHADYPDGASMVIIEAVWQRLQTQ